MDSSAPPSNMATPAQMVHGLRQGHHRGRGRLVGIEVKASATVKGDDFTGLRKLAEACGKKFIMGLVLYDHDTVVPSGKHLFAMPISALWSSAER